MTQIENTRTVQVTYDLSVTNAIVTLSIETNGAAIPDSAVKTLSGDVCTVIAAAEGVTNTIIWNAGADWPEHEVENAGARVTAWSVDAPPQVMVIDLSKGTAASWPENPYPCYYYTSLDALPGGGLSNDVYKTSLLVMTKIPHGIFDMGDESTSGASVPVKLTQDFYAGVYEVTQKQWYKVMGTDPSEHKNPSGPVEKVSYDDIRGTAAQGGGGWPTNDSAYLESFIGRLRKKTGDIAGFDLPTEAQWEYACRATTTTYFNDGIDGSDSSQLDVLGWWSGNSGSTTHTVGQKTPNQWGLYDMHGNVLEWCLDWHEDTLEGGEDPDGADSGSYRVSRGGAYLYSASFSRSAYRRNTTFSTQYYYVGFRLFRTLP